ncbi:hypothetical protein ACI1TM_04310 [Lactococcus garvieae]|nr:hypothetical protein [Lactococcus garvieae]
MNKKQKEMQARLEKIKAAQKKCLFKQVRKYRPKALNMQQKHTQVRSIIR